MLLKTKDDFATLHGSFLPRAEFLEAHSLLPCLFPTLGSVSPESVKLQSVRFSAISYQPSALS
jgi:hypothetical protein